MKWEVQAKKNKSSKNNNQTDLKNESNTDFIVINLKFNIAYLA